VLVLSGLALELSVFLTVNALVDRPRPDVPRLGELPHTSSFPSGHVAATIVLYGSVALFLSLSKQRALVQWLAWSVVVLFAACVAFSRVYRGMHHHTDVLAGALLGVACLSVAIVGTRPWERQGGRV
jgi:membrane-associated phospholipid phosphatase